jgi:hypothetical protein
VSLSYSRLLNRIMRMSGSEEGAPLARRELAARQAGRTGRVA